MKAEEPGAAGDRREPLWDELDFLPLDEPIRPAPAEAVAREAGFDEPPPAAAGDTHRTVLDMLGPTPISVDDLARQSGVPVRAVQLVLLDLELSGQLERHGGNAVSRLATPAG